SMYYLFRSLACNITRPTQTLTLFPYTTLFRSSRKIRRTLYRLGLLKPLSSIFPTWSLGLQHERAMLENHGFYSPASYAYLRDHQQEYKAIIIFSYLYPHAIFGSEIAPEKTILIPTLHEESEAFRSIQTHQFTKVKHIAFNTEEEKDLASRIFG